MGIGRADVEEDRDESATHVNQGLCFTRLGYQVMNQSAPASIELDGQEEQAEESAAVGSENPTSQKELWGWYLFEAASSGYSGSVLPIFLPLLLVTVATDRAWLELGRSSTPDACDATHKLDCLKCDPGNGDRLMTASGLVDLPKLRVYVGMLGINPVAYATVALGMSIIFQLVAFVSAGPLVDYGNRRKSVMTLSTLVGAITCILCLVIYKPELWWLGAVLLVISNVAYGLSYIAYNSYLPLLTDASSEMQEAKSLSQNKQHFIRNKVENTISLTGITVGAVLGAVCVVISFAFAFLPNISMSLILRIACCVGGVWWLVLYIPPLLWLKDRPGPPIPEHASLCLGWTNICALIKESKKFKYAWRFLVIFFIYSDGFTTVNQIGILFAQQELCMSTPELAGVAVLVNVFALVGNPLFAYIQRRLDWDNNSMVIFGLLLMSFLPVWGIVGYFTPDGSVGLKHPSEMFIFSCWYGLSLGALLSYSRTLFIDLIPAGKEGAMFSLWSLSSRGSAWVGPFVVGIIVQITGSLRSTFVYALLVMWIPTVLLYFSIDNRKGLIEAGRLCAPVSHSRVSSYDSGELEAGEPSMFGTTTLPILAEPQL